MDIVQKLEGILPEGAIAADEELRSGSVFSVSVPAVMLRQVAAEFNRSEFYLSSITGLDFQDTLEVVYHFNSYQPGSRVAVRVLCEEGAPIDTVSDIFKSASWLEREVHEFFGIVFQGNQDLRTLLLPEDADYHPLRKSFGTVQAYRKREEIYG